MINVTGDIVEALLKFVSTDTTREPIAQVLFDSAGYAVATDGHTIMVARIAPFDGESFGVLGVDLKHQISRFATKSRLQMQFPIERPAQETAKFPEWRRVWPRSLSMESAQFDSTYLERVRAARKLLTGQKNDLQTEMIPNGTGPAMVYLPPSEAKLYGFVIMPCRGSTDAQIRDAVAVLTTFGQ